MFEPALGCCFLSFLDNILTMTELKDSGSLNDFHVHVSFHLVGDATYASQRQAIEALLTSHFGATFAVEHEDPEGPTEREVVYRIQKPIILETVALKEFFTHMKELFDATQRYLPSFTQSSEVPA